jgi:hypothetical protein
LCSFLSCEKKKDGDDRWVVNETKQQPTVARSPVLAAEITRPEDIGQRSDEWRKNNPIDREKAWGMFEKIENRKRQNAHKIKAI